MQGSMTDALLPKNKNTKKVRMTKISYTTLRYLMHGILCGASSMITEYYAFESVNKSNIFKFLTHHQYNHQNLNIVAGSIFATCTLLNNSVLGKGGLSDFRQVWANVKNRRSKIIFIAKMLLGGSANLPTVYLTYITLNNLEIIPIDSRKPIAIIASLLNGLFYTMLNTTGLSLKNAINLNQEHNINKWIKIFLIALVACEGIVTALPSAINGKHFINEMIIKSSALSDAFAISALTVNAAFLANANLPVYTSLARCIKKKWFSKTDNPVMHPSSTTTLALKLIGILLFSAFASSSAPTIFRDTLKDKANHNLLDIGEIITLMVICIQSFYYLSRILFPQNQQEENINQNLPSCNPWLNNVFTKNEAYTNEV